MNSADWPAEALDRRPTVLLDRDGVINVNRPESILQWADFEFLPGALGALAALRRQGFRVVVVTNQAIVNRGRLGWSELARIHVRMIEAVEQAGGAIEAVLACPHRPEEGCSCRKPAPGLLFQAAERHGVDLPKTFLIGDHPSDLEAAWRAGCQSILVLSGRTTAWTEHYLPPGCRTVVPDLRAAVDYLLARTAAEVLRPVVSQPVGGPRPLGKPIESGQ